MIRLGFEDMNLKWIYWCVSKKNQKALRFYDKISTAACRKAKLQHMRERGRDRALSGIAKGSCKDSACSVENYGSILNMGLIWNKEFYGSRYQLNRTYYKEF